MSESAKVETRGGPLRRLYAWVMANARGPHAWAALAVLAFLEAAFLPLPPDILLLPMMLADRKRVFALATWCTGWSVTGGLLGYAIGAFFWKTWGVWLVVHLHLPLGEVEKLRALYSGHAYMMVLQVLTPVPFTVVSISAGLAQMPLGAFVVFAAVLRALRFIAMEGVIVHIFGDRAELILERYMETVVAVFVAVVVLVILVARFL